MAKKGIFTKMKEKKALKEKKLPVVTVNDGVNKYKGTFAKIHTSKKALDSHVKKLKKRGATIHTEKVAKGYKLVYSF